VGFGGDIGGGCDWFVVCGSCVVGDRAALVTGGDAVSV